MDKVPWAGHSGVYAIPQVMAEIETHGTTIVFCNPRGLAELVFIGEFERCQRLQPAVE